MRHSGFDSLAMNLFKKRKGNDQDPQKSVPCITAVGYNGIQLWLNEGFISAEVLASNLEKAWLGLHIQETTASVLTAALASKKSEASTSRTSDLCSSSLASVSPSDHHIGSSETNLGVNSGIVEEEKGPEKLVKGIVVLLPLKK
ncbi:plant UBX domain-containing protein 11 isoform X2 [Cucumis melo var. makuwa]|uniref:Plant UBX domain-containing protein 11 isoform X2 n=1 Tax=Cucumis melo var. makuwa TaxID=1194695 RepID=A0A5A7SPL7_CUCMM|nr:plant UBX domain-containing protein 11 isoform X2 [Cucumis melo var. makuwa]